MAGPQVKVSLPVERSKNSANRAGSACERTINSVSSQSEIERHLLGGRLPAYDGDDPRP
jgi:hypothetical protein